MIIKVVLLRALGKLHSFTSEKILLKDANVVLPRTYLKSARESSATKIIFEVLHTVQFGKVITVNVVCCTIKSGLFAGLILKCRQARLPENVMVFLLTTGVIQFLGFKCLGVASCADGSAYADNSMSLL